MTSAFRSNLVFKKSFWMNTGRHCRLQIAGKGLGNPGLWNKNMERNKFKVEKPQESEQHCSYMQTHSDHIWTHAPKILDYIILLVFFLLSYPLSNPFFPLSIPITLSSVPSLWRVENSWKAVGVDAWGLIACGTKHVVGEWLNRCIKLLMEERNLQRMGW